MKNAFNGLGTAGLLAGLLYAYERFDVRKGRENSTAVNSCSPVAADLEWPMGRKIAKRLDFDGDGKSDLVSWIDEEISIDLSSVAFGEFHRESQPLFGSWDTRIRYDSIPSARVWPFMEDMDSDGREDVVLYATDTGTWYIKLTRSPLSREMSIAGWDYVVASGVGAACKAILPNPSSERGVYGRPLPGDYNGDGWVDLAVVCSDGFWRIDYGGPNCSYYGQVDRAVRFLDNQQLSLAPGWAYLPIFNEVPGGRRIMAYKIPDTHPNAGVVVHIEGSPWPSPRSRSLGGNNVVVVPGRHAGPSARSLFLYEYEKSTWILFTPPHHFVRSSFNIEDDHLCMPVLGDFDGDSIDDRAVSCFDQWVISYSNQSMFRDSDGLSRVHLPQPVPKADRLVLPGVISFGGLSYQEVRGLMTYSMLIQTGPGKPISIPIDMAGIAPSQIIPRRGTRVY